ncbi:helix-turn-helix domain-containing protein [Niallia taxi]|uniref:XRE family transcriptional regulator n=1 Tax=Niallia taxi TaxID=2499688 RepID=A0A3S2X4V1_9BACI|nr:helix-turn-helix transcriptional regulator [Niallia taxi]RVT65296.1 XRE family transcriptional regulator [Niallia taxi]
MSINNFGRDIKALRTNRKIGSRELSRLIGKAETYISQLERGLIKKPDYDTAYDIVKHLGWDENKIEGILDKLYQIKSTERIAAEAAVANQNEARAAAIEEMWLQRQVDIDSDPVYLEKNRLTPDMINFESEWMQELIDKLEEQNEEIKMELSFNIEKNAKTFESVLNNLHSLLTSMRKDRKNFNFFVDLFKNDLSILSEESKDRILITIKEEVKKA